MTDPVINLECLHWVWEGYVCQSFTISGLKHLNLWKKNTHFACGVTHSAASGLDKSWYLHKSYLFRNQDP